MQTVFNLPFLRRNRIFITALAGAALSLTLTGCGLGTMAGPGAGLVSDVPSEISGHVQGGEQAIGGATVQLWATASAGTGGVSGAGYTGSATLLGTTTTGTDPAGSGAAHLGAFSFSGATACSAPDMMYVTVSGGNTGGTSANSATVLMAVAGTCPTATNNLVIDEITTVAAAYALAHFTNVDGSGNVNIVSSPTNYATVSTTPGSLKAAGLAHAMATAAILANPLSTGGANGTNPNNGGGIIPAPLINSLADVLQTCVNSTGVNPYLVFPTATGSPLASTVTLNASTDTVGGTLGINVDGTLTTLTVPTDTLANTVTYINTNDPAVTASTTGATLTITTNSVSGSPTLTFTGTAYNSSNLVDTTSTVVSNATTCGKVFAAMTPTGGTTPTNTMQAILNVALHPTQNVTAIFNRIPGTGVAFTPTMASAPPDWSVAITYVGNTGQNVSYEGNGLLYPYHLALDPSDNVMIVNSDSSSQTQANVIGLSNNGSNIFATLLGKTYKVPTFIATDALGHLFWVNNASSAGGLNVIEEMNTADGSLVQNIALSGSFPWGVAVDSSNNLWYSIASAAGANPNLVKLAYGGGTTYTPVTIGTATATQTDYAPFIDPSGNVWVNQYTNASTGAVTIGPAVLPYTGATTPPYNTPEVTASPASGKADYGVVVDASGNGWIANTGGFYKITVTGSGATLALSAGSVIAGSGVSPRYLTIDGNNTIWLPDNNATGSQIIALPTTATTVAAIDYKPCYVVIATNACGSGSTSLTQQAQEGGRVVQPDSSGNLWIASSTNHSVVEMIGIAAPSWPLLAYQKPGLLP